MSASQLKKFQELSSDLAKINIELTKLSIEMTQPVSKPVATKVVPKPASKSQTRMTKAEFMAKLTELAKASDGKVAGGYFSKLTLPLKEDGNPFTSLTELANEYMIKVIRSEDPKQTHIYLDCSNMSKPEEAKPEDAKPVQAKPPTSNEKLNKPRMTKAEFMAKLQEYATATDGKVHGGKFSKATLPLKDDGTVYNSLPELAEEYKITVIRDADPKKTHVYLDCTHLIPKVVHDKPKEEEQKQEEQKQEED
jgi:hypothetical protein